MQKIESRSSVASKKLYERANSELLLLLPLFFSKSQPDDPKNCPTNREKARFNNLSVAKTKEQFFIPNAFNNF